jgi:hypothetical protein
MIKRAALVVGLAWLGVGARPCYAQDRVADALSLGRGAMAAYESGDFASAADKFAAAEAAAHSPVFMLYRGRALTKLGKLLEARPLLERAGTESLSPESPQPWVDAAREAQQELLDLQSKISHLTITSSASQQGFDLLLDGRPLSSWQSETELELDPGNHRLELRHDGKVVLERGVSLGPGEALHVVMNEPAPATTPLATGPVHASRRIDSTAHRTMAPAYVGVAVGLAGIAVGTLAGLRALSITRDIKRDCNGNDCPERLEPATTRAQHYALASTLGFATAGAAAAFGALWYFRFSIQPSSSEHKLAISAQAQF